MAKNKNKTALMLGKRKAAASHLGLRSRKKLKTTATMITRGKSPRGSPSRTPGKDNQKRSKRKAATARTVRSKRSRKESSDGTLEEAGEAMSDTTSSDEENISDRPESDEGTTSETTDGDDQVNQQEVDPSLIAIADNIKRQLSFLTTTTRTQTKTPESDSKQNCKVKESVGQMLDCLDMKKYYPQKLKYEDVIMLTSSIYDDVDKKPTSLPELPWYFIKHVIGLDSDTRENCHVTDEDDKGEEESQSQKKSLGLIDLPWYFMKNIIGFDSRAKAEEEHSDKEMHPLDLIYIIFLCADDFLRQELIDKMSLCQYAIPLILPAPDRPLEDQKNIMLPLALKGITRTFSRDQKIETCTMMHLEAPLVSCISFGEEIWWKSKLLNKMLSPQQETFWQQELKGGNCEQKISQGMVEMAWYLPGRHGDNKFQHPMTFTNMRGDAACSEAVRNFMYKWSTVFCVFVKRVDDEVKEFLDNTRILDKLLLVVLYNEHEERRVMQQVRDLNRTYRLQKNQIICNSTLGTNFNIVHEQLKRSISNVVAMSYSSCSLSTIAREAKGSGQFDTDDEKCRIGSAAAEEILKEIDKCNQQKPRSAKKEILRLQSALETRKQIAYYEKELCRQKRLKENTTIQKYAYEMKEKKWELQHQQLQVPVSESFKHFLQCLLTLDEMNKKYFLQDLKMELNERSVRLLQPLYEEYEKCRLQDESKERENQLEELDKILTHSSLGIEHFFREMAVLYQNITALQKKISQDPDIENILDILVGTMTEAILNDTAIEIVDGDAVNVPVEWLKAVFNRVEDASNSTLFRISVLGALSSGKSTLLNTTFGLNFPVSSGRCTRGAYMQLVKVGESLKETLNCDYVGVIDSEGLMTIAGINGTYYDNELSTFITGLSDLTLVVIKGEGNEMQNVLPLAIHVFLRMNVVGEHQACHFVHQNMGAVDAMAKTATEIDAFVRDLNLKTSVAAKDTDQSDRYKKFADVLQYDPTKNNTYAPGLWDGALPMGKSNSLYARTVQLLKSDIISNAEQRGKKQKTMATFEDYTMRLDELWDAIKYENFVLSFKNVLAVEAHRKVTKIYDEEQWKMKRELRENIQQTEHCVENEIIGGNLRKTISQVVDTYRENLVKILIVKIGEVEKMVMHYFQCLGCNECDTDVKNRHLIADNEKEFKDEIRTLQRALNREIDGSMDNLEVKMKTDQCVHDMSREMDQILKKKVKEAISE